ncbi:DHH family phosphoesterase, partial [bacterium]|nr:DHH family phosphoesterase [bacterium]
MKKKIERHLETITELMDFLRGEKHVFIQLHNFPDHDAVSSGYGLQYLFKQFGIVSHLVYEGELQRNSLKRVIMELNIELTHIDNAKMQKEDKIIIVDGCKGNKNVRDFHGDEVAIVDHHQVACPEDVEFSDIRPGYGACSTIVASYFKELDIKIPKEIATTFMIGINTDTSHLTRSFSKQDQETYFECYSIADIEYLNSILRNYIEVQDLRFYQYLINNMRYFKRTAFCYFPDGCDKNLLGILGDYALALDKVDFVTLCARNGTVINFSVRNENLEWDASRLIDEVLKGVGFSGGHAEMAGGIINDQKK